LRLKRDAILAPGVAWLGRRFAGCAARWLRQTGDSHALEVPVTLQSNGEEV